MLREADGIAVAGLGANVRAWMSTRAGGVSAAPFEHLNLGRGVGDDPDAVLENRARCERLMQAPLCWLHQVHGAQCVHADTSAHAPQADAAYTCDTRMALAIQAADCLPVLFSAVGAQNQALAVAGAHAGWRGLAAGVLESTVAALRLAAPGATLRAWLGPCIGPQAFEVGGDVLAAFPGETARFRYTPRPLGDARWHGDLQGLAQDRLLSLGVSQVLREVACTFSEPSRFFSFRRDGRHSGRMAAFIRLLA